jgi:hypothetical protein
MRKRNNNQQGLSTNIGNGLPRPAELKVITKPIQKYTEVDTTPSSIHLPLLQSPLNGSAGGIIN